MDYSLNVLIPISWGVIAHFTERHYAASSTALSMSSKRSSMMSLNSPILCVFMYSMNTIPVISV